MQSVRRQTWGGFKIGIVSTLALALLLVSGSFLSLQFSYGPYTYQVKNHRLQWAIVVRLPGYEQFYDHYRFGISTHWSMNTRYRISPWCDNGVSTTPIDNELPQ